MLGKLHNFPNILKNLSISYELYICDFNIKNLALNKADRFTLKSVNLARVGQYGFLVLGERVADFIKLVGFKRLRSLPLIHMLPFGDIADNLAVKALDYCICRADNGVACAEFFSGLNILTDDSVGIDDPILHSEERLAIVLGTEGDGLHEQTIASCDYTVKIPMSHGVDSLNVAAASAVAFWELSK